MKEEFIAIVFLKPVLTFAFKKNFFFKIYLFVREREHCKQGERQVEGEASPLSKEPKMGLDPRTLES